MLLEQRGKPTTTSTSSQQTTTNSDLQLHVQLDEIKETCVYRKFVGILIYERGAARLVNQNQEIVAGRVVLVTVTSEGL